MKKEFLIDCPSELKKLLSRENGVLEKFLNLDFFNQRSATIYVNSAKSEIERNKRAQDIVNRVKFN